MIVRMQPAAQALARSLKRRRLERAISLSELARRAGVSKATLSSLERGTGNPSVDTVWALANALNVPFGDLFDGAEEDVIQVHRLEDAAIAKRPMISGGRSSTAIVYERERLPVDAPFEGPAIVEEEGATTVVPPGWRGHRDARGNLRLSAKV